MGRRLLRLDAYRGAFLRIPGILEVSIGHALIADALEMGLADAVRAYLHIVNAAGMSLG